MSEETTSVNETPSGQLAKRIGTTLVDDGLIEPEHKAQVIDLINKGEMDESKWRLEIQRVLDALATGEEAENAS